MNIRLMREPSIEGTTFGVLFVNGHFECHGLEDEIREIAGKPVDAWKVPHQTAIPAGRYEVRITPSARFQRLLPELVNVPGFSGVRLHPGNTTADTEGCILLGKDRQGGRILQSRVAFEAFFAKLAATAGPHWIAIENPDVA